MITLPPLPSLPYGWWKDKVLEDALSMLVACKRTETRLKQLHEMGHGTDYDQHRKKFAESWTAARAALENRK